MSSPDPDAVPEMTGRESKLAAAAEAEVERLIKAKSTPKWWGRAFILMALVLAVVVGFLVNKSITHPLSNQLKAQIAAQQAQTKNLELYVQQYAEHGCQSLMLVAGSLPSSPPANAAANPSREASYNLHQAILSWENADGCTLTVHHVAKG